MCLSAQIQGFASLIAARPSQSTQGCAPRPGVLPAAAPVQEFCLSGENLGAKGGAARFS